MSGTQPVPLLAPGVLAGLAHLPNGVHPHSHVAIDDTDGTSSIRHWPSPCSGMQLVLCMQGPLPASWQEYKALTAAWFPSGVFDTRHLATQLPEVFMQESRVAWRTLPRG